MEQIETTEPRRKRALFAVICGVSAFGIVGASAASLGSITGSSLGADVAVVASCDTDGVAVDFVNTYVPASGEYETTSVSVTGINAACDTLAMDLTLTGAGGTSLGNGSATLTASGTTTIAMTGVDSAAVTGVAIVIAG